MAKAFRKKLGDLLVESKIITAEQLYLSLNEQKISGKKLGEVIIDFNFAAEEQILNVLKKQLNIDIVDLKNFELEPRAIERVTENLAKRHLLIPIKIMDEDTILVAMNDPLNVFALDDVEITTRMKPVPVLAKSQQIKEAINAYYGTTKAVSLAAEFQKEIEEKKRKNVSQFDDEQSELDVANSTAVKLVNTIIDQAIIRGASDIHIEPFSEYVRVRLRIDGQLQQMLRTDISTLNGLVTRIKILGKMDIAERRLPQDGRIAVTFEKQQLDLRVSILPTVYGEKVVVRLIYHTGTIMNKEKLGFFQQELERFNQLLMNTNGVILVTGPTGSGKSTTLATAINALNKDNVNIVTVEDPVENIIEGINQVNVNVKAGLTFPEVLRSILRQDPDIVMIGEMRDTETASIAIRAAITGHLVLSTLHTNDSVSSISRLIDMGIESYMVASAVRGIIAQRLVREVCHFCCEEITISPEDAFVLEVSKDTKIKKAVGCKLCNHTGYKGRFAVHEIFILTAAVREAIAIGIKEEELRKLVLDLGMSSIWDNTIRNVLDGRTTLDEFYRVVYVQE